MEEEFKELFNYNHHFNQKLIVLFCNNLQNISNQNLKLINHLINAHQIWNARIMDEIEFNVWQINNWNDLLKVDKNNYTKTVSIITNYNLDNSIKYKNSKGLIFSNKIKDVLFHIINHTTYHRAQVATELKKCGIEPINTDYIFYKRLMD